LLKHKKSITKNRFFDQRYDTIKIMGKVTNISSKKQIIEDFGLSVTQKSPSPGHFLTENVLAPLSLSVAELANAIDVPPNRLYQIIKGSRDITIDTALRLGHFFETGPDLWLYLQTQYTLEKEQSEWSKTTHNRPTYTDFIKGNFER